MSENTTTALVAAKNSLPEFKRLIEINGLKGVDTEGIVMQELAYLENYALSNRKIATCEPISVVLAIKSVLRQNLTLDPYSGLVYVKTRNVETAQGWKTVLEIQPSANGLISIARQCKRLLDIKRPEIEKKDGVVTRVSVELLVPGHEQPRWEKYEFDEDDFYRWRLASHKENGRKKEDANAETLNYANPNYTSFRGGIDPEFARAKAIRHALKKLGTNRNEVIMPNGPLAPFKGNVVDPAADLSTVEDVTHEDVTGNPVKTEPEGQNSMSINDLNGL